MMRYKIIVPNYATEYCWRRITATRLVDYYLTSGAHEYIDIYKFNFIRLRYELSDRYRVSGWQHGRS